MRRLIRFGVFALIAAVLICAAVFTLGRSTPRRTQPTAAAIVETDPTSPPSPPAPTSIPRGYVSRALMGDAWPLTIDEGTIVCDRTAILLRAPDGRLYAVNGTALGQMTAMGWRDIHDIDVPDPSGGSGVIISLQPLLDVGLDLCR